MSKRVTYQRSETAYLKQFCYELVFSRMPFKKRRGENQIWRRSKRDTWRRVGVRQERQQETYWNKSGDTPPPPKKKNKEKAKKEKKS